MSVVQSLRWNAIRTATFNGQRIEGNKKEATARKFNVFSSVDPMVDAPNSDPQIARKKYQLACIIHTLCSASQASSSSSMQVDIEALARRIEQFQLIPPSFVEGLAGHQHPTSREFAQYLLHLCAHRGLKGARWYPRHWEPYTRSAAAFLKSAGLVKLPSFSNVEELFESSDFQTVPTGVASSMPEQVAQAVGGWITTNSSEPLRSLFKDPTSSPEMPSELRTNLVGGYLVSDSAQAPLALNSAKKLWRTWAHALLAKQRRAELLAKEAGCSVPSLSLEVANEWKVLDAQLDTIHGRYQDVQNIKVLGVHEKFSIFKVKYRKEIPQTERDLKGQSSRWQTYSAYLIISAPQPVPQREDLPLSTSQKVNPKNGYVLREIGEYTAKTAPKNYLGKGGEGVVQGRQPASIDRALSGIAKKTLYSLEYFNEDHFLRAQHLFECDKDVESSGVVPAYPYFNTKKSVCVGEAEGAQVTFLEPWITAVSMEKIQSGSVVISEGQIAELTEKLFAHMAKDITSSHVDTKLENAAVDENGNLRLRDKSAKAAGSPFGTLQTMPYYPAVNRWKTHLSSSFGEMLREHQIASGIEKTSSSIDSETLKKIEEIIINEGCFFRQRKETLSENFYKFDQIRTVYAYLLMIVEIYSKRSFDMLKEKESLFEMLRPLLTEKAQEPVKDFVENLQQAFSPEVWASYFYDGENKVSSEEQKARTIQKVNALYKQCRDVLELGSTNQLWQFPLALAE